MRDKIDVALLQMGANVLKMNEICNVTNNSNNCCIYLPVKKATANVKTWINGNSQAATVVISCGPEVIQKRCQLLLIHQIAAR